MVIISLPGKSCEGVLQKEEHGLENIILLLLRIYEAYSPWKLLEVLISQK